ncbi:MAG: cupredoxin domain-containing protein [Chloroflexi bacterium]|nr:cupredoxin domain-containing protein [Chloroflexota bacterium]
MAEEEQGKKRRRGRHRDKKDANGGPEGGAGNDDLSRGDVSGETSASDSDVPDVVADQPETADDQPEDEEPEDSGKASRRERTKATVGGGEVSPMDFWRSGSMRSARDRRAGAPTEQQGFFQRIRNIYLPPWVPVVAIILVVFGVLGLLFVVRSATGAPRIGVDHWHAQYTYYICGEKQPPAPTWEGVGVHTHTDGIIHIHPFQQSEEGAGARLTKWFDYGGGKLDGDEVRMPGSADTYKNGDECPDGTVGEVQIFVSGAKVEDYKSYLPKDGDRVRIVFGPPEEQVQLDDRIVLPEELATREVTITIDQPDDANEASTTLTPASISVDAGEVVRINVINADEVSHGLRIAGFDGEYGTIDDFAVVPDGSDPTEAGLGDILQPGESGFVIVRFDDAGQIEFRDPTVITATGVIVIAETTATETPAPEEDFDEEFDLGMQDDRYEPNALVIGAGTKVKLNLINLGEFVHNIRIAGPDGIYDTDDDIVSEDVLPGETGELIFVVDEEGEYIFRDDFRRETLTGILTVE